MLTGFKAIIILYFNERKRPSRATPIKYPSQGIALYMNGELYSLSFRTLSE